MEDFHVHTDLSVCGLHHGGRGYTDREIVKKLEGKLESIGLCDHMEGFTDVKRFMKVTKKRRGWIPDNVHLGAEVSFIPSLRKLTLPKKLAKEFDYLIGSVHTLPYYAVDHSHASFYEKKVELYGEEKLAAAYIDAIKGLAPHVQVIGHPFSPFIRVGRYLGDEFVSQFAEAIDGRALAEINLRVLRRRDKPIFKRYLESMREEGCEFCLGSDAHSFEELKYDIVEPLLRETGIKSLGSPVA